MKVPRTLRLALLAVTCLPLTASLTGCIFGKPNPENINLRKKVQGLEDRVATLQQQHEADQVLIRSIRQRVPTIPTLSTERLDELFTAHGLKVGKLTGGYDLDPKKPGDKAIKVYLVPTDEDGQPLKAAGSFSIDAFDLADADKPHIGHWEFERRGRAEELVRGVSRLHLRLRPHLAARAGARRGDGAGQVQRRPHRPDLRRRDEVQGQLAALAGQPLHHTQPLLINDSPRRREGTKRT